MLSIDDIIVSQKGSNGEGKFKLYGRDYYCNVKIT